MAEQLDRDPCAHSQLPTCSADAASAPSRLRGKALGAASTLALSLAKALRQGTQGSTQVSGVWRSGARSPHAFTLTHACPTCLQSSMHSVFADPVKVLLALQRVPTAGERFVFVLRRNSVSCQQLAGLKTLGVARHCRSSAVHSFNLGG